ncbi:MAG: transporter substrate-binding domain-containing protein [Myxococcota bacterium]
MLPLTDAERDWIEQHPSVRVAFDGHFPPYSFRNERGQLEGLAIDVFELLAERTGLEFVVHDETRWADLYASAQQYRLDAVATMVQRPDRSEWFEFTQPYLFKSLVVMTRVDDERIRQKQNLAGKTLALVRSYQHVSRVLEEFPSAKPVYFTTMLDALNAVSVGQADAAITFLGGGHYLQTKYLMTNLRFAAIYDRDHSLESIAVRKDWPRLASILDKALASISERERLALESRWLPLDPTLSEGEQLPLTEAEQAWIREHPVIRVGVDPEFRPFEYIDEDGSHAGIAADYIELLNERLGLNMELVPGLTWEAAIEGGRHKEIDVLPAVGVTEERKRFFRYSAPYIEFHRVIVTRTEMPFLVGVDDIRDMRVAVQADSSHEGFLKEHTEIEPLRFATLQQSLMAVSGGDADALVTNVASASYWIRRLNLTNLKVATATSPKVHTLHFAVRDDWPELVRILDKGLVSVHPDERERIADRWVVLAFDPRTDYGLLLKTSAAASLVVLLILLWNRQLQRHRARLQLAESEARSANSALIRMHAELEDRVRSRTEALMETERALHQAQKMEALGTLVGGIAHDFNNILTGMLGSIRLIQLGVADATRTEELLQRSSALGYRGADMIQQLLSFARQEDSSKADISMTSFLDETAVLIQTALPSSIELIVSRPDDEEFIVHGSATRLQQVLLNLSNNARDAVADGEGAVIRVELYGTVGDAELDRKHAGSLGVPYVVIEVGDNGAGIPKDVLESIFDPFFSTKAPGRGTGLGLAMAYGAVQADGGFIEVESTVGVGSSFRVFLPRATGPAEAAEIEDQTVYHGSGECILLADDDPEVLEVMRSILESLDYRVLTAVNGEEAVGLYTSKPERVDLVLLDVVMPRMGGVAAARRIWELNSRARIVFLSGYDPAERPGAGLPVDVITLQKPCPVSRLSRVLKEQLGS